MKFQPGSSGNPRGRARGSRNKATLLREQLDRRGKSLLVKLIALAESGDVDALKFLIGRLLPPAKEFPIQLEAVGSLLDRGESVLRATLDGRITPEQCASLLASLKAQADLAAHTDLENRIAKLEGRIKAEP